MNCWMVCWGAACVFHPQLHCNNFLDSIDRYLETRIDREHNAVVMRGHRTLVRPYPISLEWPVRWAESAPGPEECRAQVWREFGLKPNALLGVGVDRLDYTKGIEERLLAVERLLERIPSSAADSVSPAGGAPAGRRSNATGIERKGRGAGGPHQPAVRGRRYQPTSCCAPTMSRQKCFGSIAPPMFAT